MSDCIPTQQELELREQVITNDVIFRTKYEICKDAIYYLIRDNSSLPFVAKQLWKDFENVGIRTFKAILNYQSCGVIIRDIITDIQDLLVNGVPEVESHKSASEATPQVVHNTPSDVVPNEVNIDEASEEVKSILKMDLSISEDNPWVGFRSRSKYIGECVIIHEILTKGFFSSNDLYDALSIPTQAYAYAMGQYYDVGFPGWKIEDELRNKRNYMHVYKEDVLNGTNS